MACSIYFHIFSFHIFILVSVKFANTVTCASQYRPSPSANATKEKYSQKIKITKVGLIKFKYHLLLYTWKTNKTNQIYYFISINKKVKKLLLLEIIGDGYQKENTGLKQKEVQLKHFKKSTTNFNVRSYIDVEYYWRICKD